MAAGDKRTGATSLAPGGIWDIRPPVGEEWTIHNIFFPNGTAEGQAVLRCCWLKGRVVKK